MNRNNSITYEHRTPFGIVDDNGEESAFHYLTKAFLYKYRVVKSDLLIAIDSDNVQLMKKCLMKDKIDVNQKYVLPPFEIPEADQPYQDTFLHRAVFAGSKKCFKALLAMGADPKARNYMDEDVFHFVNFYYPEFQKLFPKQVDSTLTKKALSQRDGR